MLDPLAASTARTPRPTSSSLPLVPRHRTSPAPSSSSITAPAASPPPCRRLPWRRARPPAPTPSPVTCAVTFPRRPPLHHQAASSAPFPLFSIPSPSLSSFSLSWTAGPHGRQSAGPPHPHTLPDLGLAPLVRYLRLLLPRRWQPSPLLCLVSRRNTSLPGVDPFSCSSSVRQGPRARCLSCRDQDHFLTPLIASPRPSPP